MSGNGLATRARPHTRESLTAMCEDVYHEAKHAERTYSNSKGEIHTVPCPDFKAQLGAIRLLAELHGLLKVQAEGDGFAEHVWPRKAEAKEKRS